MLSLQQLLRCLLPLLLLGSLGSCTVYDHFFHPHRIGNPPMTAAAKAKAKAADKARHSGQSTTLKPADGAPAAPTAPGTVPGVADDAAAAAPAAPADARSLDDKNKAIEDMLGHTYNPKTGLVKRTMLQRSQAKSRQLHHYDTGPLPGRAPSRDARKMRKQTHTKGGKGSKEAPSPKERADEPLTDDNAPAPATKTPLPKPDPTQPAAKVVKPKAARPTKAAPAPRAKPAPKEKPAPREKPAPKEKPVKTPKVKKINPEQEMSEKANKTKKAPVPKPDPTQPQPFKGD